MVSRTRDAWDTVNKRDENVQADILMTMSQTGAADVEFRRAELLSKIHAALDARIISDDYAQTLIELVELVLA